MLDDLKDNKWIEVSESVELGMRYVSESALNIKLVNESGTTLKISIFVNKHPQCNTYEVIDGTQYGISLPEGTPFCFDSAVWVKKPLIYILKHGEK